MREVLGAEPGIAVASVVLGAGFLYVFYKAIQLNWPESYFGVGEMAAYAISASPIRYTFFRFGPVYATALFAGVAVDRAGGDGLKASLGVGLAHALLTSGWGLLQATRWPTSLRRQRLPVLLVRSVVFVGVVGVAALAGFSRNVLAAVIPPISEISATLWTGVVAGVLGAFVVRISRGHPVHEQEMVERARREIPRELWSLAATVALDAGADPDLVRSVMIVEHIQRPRWFRGVERLKGRVQRAGTYGIMQIRAERPLSDAESIAKAVPERFSGVVVRGRYGYADSTALAEFARSYNPSRDYRSLLEVAYDLIRPSTEGLQSSRLKAQDNRPAIEVEVFERLNGVARIEGTAVVFEGTLLVAVLKDDEVLGRTWIQASAGQPERGPWGAAVEVPADATMIVISGTPMEEDSEESRVGNVGIVDLRAATSIRTI